MPILYIWEQDGFKCKAWSNGRRGKDNRIWIDFEVYDGDFLVFKNALSPSPMHDLKRLEIVMDCLEWATVKPGDTDEDYFKDHTPEQMEWLDSGRVDDLKMIVYDYQESMGRY